MSDHPDRTVELQPLGIEEVRERLEISPLLAGGGDELLREGPSCTCKILVPNDPDLGDEFDDDFYWWQLGH